MKQWTMNSGIKKNYKFGGIASGRGNNGKIFIYK